MNTLRTEMGFTRLSALSPCLAGYTSREGGVSPAPFDTLNLGSNTADLPANILSNRQLLEMAVGRRLVYMKQVHGNTVLRADKTTDDGIECDGLVTCDSGICVAVLTADCLPLLLCAEDGRICAAVHCGWRGTVCGIAAKAVGLMRDIAGNSIKIRAFIGPCIRQESFEVGPEVKEAALSGLGNEKSVAECFSAGRGDRLMCSLPALARLSLEMAGVRGDMVSDCGIDTFNDPACFSWRRSRNTGRQASFIGPAG